MRKSRFSEEQIIRFSRAHENVLKVAEICRQHGISERTYYLWKSEYDGMEVSEVKRLRELEAENRKLKQLIGEKKLDIIALKATLSKKY